MVPTARRPVGHEHLGLRIADDVGDLGADQVVVDRHQIPARLQTGQIQLDHLGAVGEEGGDGVALLQAQGAQAVDDPVALAQELAGADLAAVGIDQRHVTGISLRQRPKPQIGHVTPLSVR
jgi:hypothetical protein